MNYKLSQRFNKVWREREGEKEFKKRKGKKREKFDSPDLSPVRKSE